MSEIWNRLKQWAWEVVWGDNLNDLPGHRALPLKVCRIAHMVVREMVDGYLNLRVGGLVYTTLLSLVPALAVSFAVLKAFNVHESFEPALVQALEPLGSKGPEIAGRAIEVVEGLNLAKLGSVGFAALLFTVITLVYKIELALNDAWRVRRPRGLISRISGYTTVVMVGPVLVFTAVGMTASVMQSDVVREYSQGMLVTFLLAEITRLVPYALLFAAFTCLYLYIPNTRVRWRSAMVGGVVAGLLWATAGWAFASLVVSSARYTVIYSGFAIVILFMMWLHIAWLIVLVGGSVAFYHQNPEYLGLLTYELQMSSRVRDRLGLMVCYRIGANFRHGLSPPTLALMSREFGVPLAPLSVLLEALEKAGVVARTATTPATFVPARSLEVMTLDELLGIIRSAHESKHLTVDRISVAGPVGRLFDGLDAERTEILAGRTLRDLIDEDELTPNSGRQTLATASLPSAADKKAG